MNSYSDYYLKNWIVGKNKIEYLFNGFIKVIFIFLKRLSAVKKINKLRLSLWITILHYKIFLWFDHFCSGKRTFKSLFFIFLAFWPTIWRAISLILESKYILSDNLTYLCMSWSPLFKSMSGRELLHLPGSP